MINIINEYSSISILPVVIFKISFLYSISDTTLVSINYRSIIKRVKTQRGIAHLLAKIITLIIMCLCLCVLCINTVLCVYIATSVVCVENMPGDIITWNDHQT